MFDMSKRITLVGTVTSFEWTNPHSYIEIDVPDAPALSIVPPVADDAAVADEKPA